MLVWYAPDAIYFGIRAFEPHGDVRSGPPAPTATTSAATTTSRSCSTPTTTGAGRFLFGVNPFGVQQDGIRSDSSGGAGGASGGGGGFGG